MPQLPETLDAGPLLLRRWSRRDVDHLLCAIEASYDELHRWMDWAQTRPTPQALLAVLENGEASFEADTEWGYVMLERATDELVGGTGIHPRIGPGGLEIGYWVRTDRTGQGYATAAAGALTTAAFQFAADIERVEIHMDKANHASAAVPAKLGYRLVEEVAQERTAPGHTGRGLIWRITREEWGAPRTATTP